MRFKNGSKVEVMNKEVPASWCVAEIVSGNGDAYNVRYDGYKGVQKVSRRFIRPSPAKRSLKIGSHICEEEDDCLPIYNDVRLHNSHVVSRNRKRASPFCSSLHDPCHIAKKVKPAEKDGSQRYVSGHASKKVDAFVGNKYIQASFNNSLNGYYEMEKRKTNGVSRISEPYDESDSDQCSVGSCSVHSETNNVSSDGESLNISSDDVAVSIHRLELHAYRSTLEALYASGPLSWEKEALLTNLRINLRISNDEHLIELRHLISSGVN